MVDYNQTFESYLNICKIDSIEPHNVVKNAFSNSIKAEKEDNMKEFIDPKDKSLNLRGNNYFNNKAIKLTDIDVNILYKTLKNNLFITGLDLRYNEISDYGASVIAKLLLENTYLLDLNLMCNDIGPNGAEQIANALQKNHSLRYLNLNGNKIENKGGMCMAQMLQVNVSLLYLDLGQTDMKIESLIAISTVLNYNKNLQSLNINRPVPQHELTNWMDEIPQHYAIMLKKNNSLHELHMQHYEMRDYGAQWFSEKLVDNKALYHLDLSCNRITRDGAKYLCEFLKSNTPLRILDLGYNRLEDDGAVSIADALTFANTSLEKLSIKYNNIGSVGLCALAESLKYNSNLSHIYIWGNNLESNACVAFNNLIKSQRIEPENTDVRPYEVDKCIYLSELSNGITMYYYWQPTFGERTGADNYIYN